MKAVFSALFTALLLVVPAVSAPITYYANLSGPNEAPPNNSPGTGFGQVTIDVVAHTLLVDMVFSNLTVANTASHIHCCTTVPLTGTAGVATSVPTFIGFPTGTTSGTYNHTFDLLSSVTWNPAFVTANGGTTAGAEAALAAGLAAGESYLNIHTGNFPNGEIRGFLQPVPEPGTFVIGAAALLGLAIRKRAGQSRCGR